MDDFTTKENIKNILGIAVNAPSGENSQPWRFEVEGNKIHIFNIPGRSHSLYIFEQKGTLIAHGALIENILITAPVFGYNATIVLLPDDTNYNFVATISLDEALSNKQEDEPLYPYIVKRATNRKSYRRTPLKKEQLEDLEHTANEIGEKGIVLIQDPKRMKDVAIAGSVYEQVMFSNRSIHNFFFEHISWTKKEEAKKKIGLYIKTLELPPFTHIVLKLLRHWAVMSLLNKLGAAKIIAKVNAAKYATASAMAVFTVKDNSLRDFIVAGRLMQRLWLKITKMGLSAQPIAGTLFFMHAITEGEADTFASSHVVLIKNAYAKIKDAFGLGDEIPVMVLRIGNGGEPSARAPKKPPEIIFRG